MTVQDLLEIIQAEVRENPDVLNYTIKRLEWNSYADGYSHSNIEDIFVVDTPNGPVFEIS